MTAPVSVKTTYIVGDGQEAGNAASFDGTTLPDVSFPGADPQAVPNYSQGNLWDTVTTDVSALASPGDTSASLSVTGNADCIVWVGQVLAVSVPLRYVALGDSYSSGEANPPFVTAKGKCDLSRNHAWPELLAAEDTHLQLVADLACSGATTSALESPFKGQPGELKAMKKLDPSVITITIAGNNVGFRSVLENCYLWIVCDKDGALATASRKISGLASVMPGIYREIKTAAPKGARIYVVGYPRLLPLSRHNVFLHCPWLSGTVQAKLNALAVKLNSVLAAAAKKAGVDYIPTLNAFSGHELCSAHPWVRALQAKNREYSGHPLLRGQEALAAIVEKAIG